MNDTKQPTLIRDILWPVLAPLQPNADEQECSELARAIAPLVLNELISGTPHEDTPRGRALTAAVYRAVDQLEGQGARSERIALQLLTALAHYETDLGQCWVTDEITPPVNGGRFFSCDGLTPESIDALGLIPPEAGPVGVDCHGGDLCNHYILPRYRIEFCHWVEGGDAEHQDWMHRFEDEPSDDRDRLEQVAARMDTEFPMYRHRVVSA